MFTIMFYVFQYIFDFCRVIVKMTLGKICRSTRVNYRPIRESLLVNEKGNLDTRMDSESHDEFKYPGVYIYKSLFNASSKSMTNTEYYTNSVVDSCLSLYFNIFSKISIFVMTSETSKRLGENMSIDLT
jgi:hypothetical protein